MWLSRPALVRSVRRTYAELDYARHIPKEYIEQAKRTVPRKIYDNRFGAPPVIRWFRPPDDYVPGEGRPWEPKAFAENLGRARKYHNKKLHNKFFIKRHDKVETVPDEKWTIFPGDIVQVMVGRDKGNQGIVQKVIRESNSVYVEGLHKRLEAAPENKKHGFKGTVRWIEQPLDYLKGQVKLVDPNSNEACDAIWALNDAKDEYIRISVQSGFEIPIPSQAFVTYEYLLPQAYIEVLEKDTPANLVLERTYKPKLCSFEEEIMEEMGIVEERVPKPTFWY